MKHAVRLACVATAVFAAIVGQAIVAGPAAAITGLVREAQNSAVNSSDKTFQADCEDDTVVTGGAGYLVAVSPSPKGKVSFAGLRPLADGSGFQVTAREVDVDFMTNWQSVAVALCAPAPSGYEVVEETSGGGSASSRTADVTCTDPNDVAIGAGAYITGGDRRVFLESAVPDGNTVTATAHETQTGTGASWTVTAVAVCADEPAGWQPSSSTTTAASDTYDSMSRVCPNGKEMYGTGFSINSGAGQVLLYGLNVVPETTIRLAANEDANGYGSNWSMTTYAQCAS